MPEGLEAEMWRRACEPLVGRTIVDGWSDVRAAPPRIIDDIAGATFAGVRRLGKVLLLDLAGAPRAEPRDGDLDVRTLGLHFGMTGRLVVDGFAPIERLAYASARDDRAWDRFVLSTSPNDSREPSTPALRFNDPRRLGKITLDADLSALGVDCFALTAGSFAETIRGRRRALKPLLLDQGVVAGLGNLLADEMLWWAGLSPHRGADTLSPGEIEHLVTVVRSRLPVMLERGGSTTGSLSPEVRAVCPPCSRDGAPLRRETIGGRSAVWCPEHQH